MLFYHPADILWMVLAAIIVDWVIGDPPWPKHPVILIGQLIRWLEARLHPSGAELPQARSPRRERFRGILLTVAAVVLSSGLLYALIAVLYMIHPWVGRAANIWFISTTIAFKGLKDAAMQVYRPLAEGNLAEARRWVGYIVGRDTAELDEPEITRAAVETVAENTVDAAVSPLFFALLGGAPLALAYRAANTLDSMVGYRNDRYRDFGWASARLDDLLNLLPARITALLLALAAGLTPGLSGKRALRSVRSFAALHPSPNSGYPESAVAGALGVQLGGRNVYGGVISQRAVMGWPLQPLERSHIRLAVRLLYITGYFIAGGVLCAIAVQAGWN
ncbi:adenosylcobinamide-phosphate synthase CbiB [Paenibacillus sp. YN15]|uniref:adenosylcobinamide-phosphate synthase CbiB n=1 Tax=Paenibacillus sp. YN15 TaxID=1742774 RepID=UPI000DCCC4AD|nr:adenosylcobinamide-phosphate synthase CbiB [Paenibacillus sp. YN15]RAU97615.1 cobalamin biosynthesis protein CobD [Paenibacillus sp. YN15]